MLCYQIDKLAMLNIVLQSQVATIGRLHSAAWKNVGEEAYSGRVGE